MLVKDFKIEITGKIGIPADMQRLIFRGRVLQDDKKMGECSKFEFYRCFKLLHLNYETMSLI